MPRKILAQPLAERRTLERIETRDFRVFHRGTTALGTPKWYGYVSNTAGQWLEANITDPALPRYLDDGYEPGEHCLVTISLARKSVATS